ncbi:Oxidoreductase [Candidatus Magnetomoraceae bacterium gMMP-1]
MLNIGIIGTGYWGKNLVRNAYAHKSVGRLLVCDLNKDSLKHIKLSFPDVEPFEDIDTALSQPWLDAVIIATPPEKHAEHAKKALKKRLHVLIEKPFTTSVDDASSLIELADKNHLILMVDHTFLYNNIVEEVQKLVAEGELGEIFYMYSRRVNLGIVRRDVNVFWNLAPHDISIANYILGECPEKVAATAYCYIQKNLSVPDVAYITLIYKNGISVHIHDSWLDPLKRRDMIIVGSKKMLIYDDINSDRHIQIFDKSISKKPYEEINNFADYRTVVRSGELRIPNIRLKEPLAKVVDHFITCIENDITPKTDGIHACKVVSILEAIETSIKNNSSIVPIEYPAF